MTEQSNKTVTVWCVKYALATGIIFKVTGKISNGYFLEHDDGRKRYMRLVLKDRGDYRLTPEEAKAAVEELRQRKIEFLRKELDAIEKQLNVIRAKEVRIES